MPKVYLEVDDPNSSTTGRVVCEQWLNLESGLHQELVSQLTSSFFSACFGFWRWLERQNALLALGDPESPMTDLPISHHRSRRSSRRMIGARLRTGGGDWPVLADLAVLGLLERPLALEAGLLVEVEVELLLDFGECLAASSHDDLGGREQLVEREAGGNAAVEDRRERRDVLGQERAGGQDVAHHADGRARC